MNAEEIPFDRRMLEALICPRTQMRLTYDADKQELISDAAGLADPQRYPRDAGGRSAGYRLTRRGRIAP